MVWTTGIFPGWTGYFPREKSGEFEGKIRLAHKHCPLAKRLARLVLHRKSQCWWVKETPKLQEIAGILGEHDACSPKIELEVPSWKNPVNSREYSGSFTGTCWFQHNLRVPAHWPNAERFLWLQDTIQYLIRLHQVHPILNADAQLFVQPFLVHILSRLRAEQPSIYTNLLVATRSLHYVPALCITYWYSVPLMVCANIFLIPPHPRFCNFTFLELPSTETCLFTKRFKHKPFANGDISHDQCFVSCLITANDV